MANLRRLVATGLLAGSLAGCSQRVIEGDFRGNRVKVDVTAGRKLTMSHYNPRKPPKSMDEYDVLVAEDRGRGFHTTFFNGHLIKGRVPRRFSQSPLYAYANSDSLWEAYSHVLNNLGGTDRAMQSIQSAINTIRYSGERSLKKPAITLPRNDNKRK